MIWILMGAALFLLIRNRFDLQGVKKDVRRIFRIAAKIAKDIARTVQEAVREAKKEREEIRKAETEPVIHVEKVCEEQPEESETQESNALLKEMEQNASIAAKLASIPTMDFPEEDPKYASARKYTYAS